MKASYCLGDVDPIIRETNRKNGAFHFWPIKLRKGVDVTYGVRNH